MDGSCKVNCLQENWKRKNKTKPQLMLPGGAEVQDSMLHV